MTACVCAIMKHEDDYVVEWLHWYKCIGVNHIFLYDNNNDNKDRQTYYNALFPGFVTVINWPGNAQQIPAYAHCLNTVKQIRKYEWIAYFDLDEFLVLKQHDNILSFLSKFPPNVASVQISWLMFGSGGLVSKSMEPVLQRFTSCEPAVNQHVKTITRVSGTMSISHPHFTVISSAYKAVDAAGQINNSKWQIENKTQREHAADVAILHHYFTKSYDEWVAKRNRGRSDDGTIRNMQDFNGTDSVCSSINTLAAEMQTKYAETCPLPTPTS
jgi:hypothetical protein